MNCLRACWRKGGRKCVSSLQSVYMCMCVCVCNVAQISIEMVAIHLSAAAALCAKTLPDSEKKITTVGSSSD